MVHECRRKVHPMSIVEQCASAARVAALQGAGVEEILEQIVMCLGESLRPIAFIAVLREAFGVPVQTLRDLENWERLHASGDMTTPEVVALLRPWIGSVADSP